MRFWCTTFSIRKKSCNAICNALENSNALHIALQLELTQVESDFGLQLIVIVSYNSFKCFKRRSRLKPAFLIGV